MDMQTALIFVLFTVLCASYGWGMRGAVIGGEKGAMLPGALIGLAFGWFSGYGILSTAAAGLMGMTFGGIEPYGETIGFVLHRGKDDYNPKRGYIGLAFKGALWFAVCGAFLGIALSRGIYSNRDIVIFCLLIPVMQILGQLIFNRPYNKNENKFPKIYFSKTRREEWGGNLLMLIAIVIMAVVKADCFTLMLVAGGLIFGAIGWLVGMKAFVIALFPMKNGKYFFGKLCEKGVIDGWKLMEFLLGAFGGLGLALAYLFGYDYVEGYRMISRVEGIQFVDEWVSEIAPIICVLCVAGILAVNLICFICDKKGKKVNSYLFDFIERPFYNVIPMILVLIGETFSAKFMTAFMLIFVCAVKCVLDRFEKSKLLIVGQFVSAVVCGLAFVYCFADYCSPLVVVICGIVPYMIAELVWAVWENKQKGKDAKYLMNSTAFATVYPCFAVMCVMIAVASIKIFAV